LEILKITPKRYQDSVLWAWLEMFSTPKRYQFKNNTSPAIFFWLNALKGTGNAKVPTVDFWRLKTLKGTKTSVFNP